MPQRILRDKILTSEKVEVLDFPAEVFYRRLMSVVDDFGRFDGRPSVLRSACYPLRVDRIREADISRWIAICEKAGLIVLYQVDGKPYVELLNLDDRRRAKTSKYPSPPSGSNCQHVSADDNICAHVSAHAGTCQHVPPESNADAHSESEPPTPKGASSEEFWRALPQVARDRSSRKLVEAQWKRSKCGKEPDAVIAGLERWKVSAQWAKENGQYIPAAHRWLKAEKWRDPPAESEPETSETGFVRAPVTDEILEIAFPSDEK